MVQGTGTNEVPDLNDNSRRFLWVATYFCTQELLLSDAVRRRQIRLSNA